MPLLMDGPPQPQKAPNRLGANREFQITVEKVTFRLRECPAEVLVACWSCGIALCLLTSSADRCKVNEKWRQIAQRYWSSAVDSGASLQLSTCRIPSIPRSSTTTITSSSNRCF